MQKLFIVFAFWLTVISFLIIAFPKSVGAIDSPGFLKYAEDCDKVSNHVRVYDPLWLEDPIVGIISTGICFNFCNKQFLEQAKTAYVNPKSSDDARKIIDNFMKSGDENKGPGGKLYESIGQCKATTNLSGDDPFTDTCTFSFSSPNSSCRISNETFMLNLLITGLPVDGGGNYHYCLKSSSLDCDNDDLKSASKKLATEDFKTVTLNLTVCGKGKKELKETCNNTGESYFWPGSTYRITVYDKKNALSGNIIASNAFYVSHIYPTIIEPAPGPAPYLSMDTIKEKAVIPIQLAYVKAPAGKYKDSEALGLGPYWIQAVGDDYISPPICTLDGLSTVGPPLILPLNSTIFLGTTKKEETFRLNSGIYKIIIKQAKILNRDAYEKDIKIINEFRKNPKNKPKDFLENQEKWCGEGDFTYYHIPFSIGAGSSDGIIAPAIPDPLGKELNINLPLPTLGPICTHIDLKTGYCLSVPTGLGIEISTRPQLFIRDIFTIVLSIGGIAAIVFFIQAGYTLMTSAGNKEKIGAAREQITAAIMGLIFIILSITILEFIGINILHIPGFGN